MNTRDMQLVTVLSILLFLMFFYSYFSSEQLIYQNGPAESGEERESALISGCDFLIGAKECVLLESKTIKFWVPADALPNVQVMLNDQVLSLNEIKHKNKNGVEQSITAERVLNGFVLELSPDEGTHHLEIRNARKSFDWQILLKKHPPPFWIKNYRNYRKSHQFEQAIEWLLTRTNGSDTTENGLVLYYLARTYLAIGKVELAIDYLVRSTRIFDIHAIHNKVVDNQTVLAFIYLNLRDDIIKTKEILTSLPELTFDANSLFLDFFYRGNLAERLGDLRRAEDYFVRSRSVAEKFGLKRQLIDTEHVYSRVLLKSGDVEHAEKIREAIVKKIPEDWSDCRRFRYYNGLGWARIQGVSNAVAMGRGYDKDPLPALEYSLKILEQSCSELLLEKASVLLNLGKVNYLKNNIFEAKNYLARVHDIKKELTFQQDLEVMELEALLALKNAELKPAVKLYSRILKKAKQVEYSDFVLKALVGLAEAYELLGEHATAIEHYTAASQLVFDHVLEIPIIGSQENFLSNNLAFSFKYVSLLNKLGERDAALKVVRKFRAYWLDNILNVSRTNKTKLMEHPDWLESIAGIQRLRKSIIARNAKEWQLSQEELKRAQEMLVRDRIELSKLFDRTIRLANNIFGDHKGFRLEPKNDELFLFFYPARNGWLGFAVDGIGVYSHAIGAKALSETSFSAMAQEWVSVFSSHINQANTVKIYPFGQLKNVDFQELTLAGDILLAQKNVVYGVDLKVSREMITSTERNVKTLIVANTLGDLKETESEAKTVARLVSESEWNSQVLTGKDVSFSSVKSSLEKAEHFHYAGHVYRGPGRKLQHYFPLSDNTSMTGQDILMLNQVPQWVVLSACDSASTDRSISSESLGLAQAFVVSGSQFVIATVRKVSDTEANLLMTEFYRRWMESRNFVNSLRLAQLELLKSHPDHDWLAFRLLTF